MWPKQNYRVEDTLRKRSTFNKSLYVSNKVLQNEVCMSGLKSSDIIDNPHGDSGEEIR